MGLLAGHTGSWAAAYPEIVTCHGQFWLPNLEDWSLRFAAEPGGVGQLNPLHPQTYKVVKNVIDEVADMFPDNFFHGGGDEVTAGCWNNSSDIQVPNLNPCVICNAGIMMLGVHFLFLKLVPNTYFCIIARSSTSCS